MSRTRESKGLCLALLVLGAAATLTGCIGKEEPAAMGICYQVLGGKNPMVILGSIHVGDDTMQRYSASVLEAIERADVFVFECDNESQAAKETVSRMMRADKPLSEVVTAETYNLLQEVAAKERLSLKSLEELKPWAAANMLSSQVAAVQLGTKNASQALALGVEPRVRAYAGNRERSYLETAEEQLLVLDGFSQALQEELLKGSCQTLLDPAAAGSLKDWPTWWREGNAAAFAQAYATENELNDPALSREYHDALLTNRNRHMAQRLQGLLEGEESHTYFVTIGLLHLVLPEDSVLAELENMGYQVLQIIEEDKGKQAEAGAWRES